MTSRRLSAVAKRDRAPAPHVKTLDTPKGANYPVGRMLIASPLAIAEEVATIPRGRVITLPTLRARLARKFGADYTCPITTGIFLRIAADAAREEARADALPVWRVVREDGACIEKLMGSRDLQAARLREEGVTVVPRRTQLLVADLESRAVTE